MVGRIIVGTLALSTLFSLLFGILGYFDGVSSRGVNYYGWDAYWIVSGISFACCIGMALFGFLMVLIGDWMIGSDY